MYKVGACACALSVPLGARRAGANSRAESDISRRTEDDLAVGQAQLLEARATLDLRNSVVENVVAVQPILNAVHRATQASPAER